MNRAVNRLWGGCPNWLIDLRKLIALAYFLREEHDARFGHRYHCLDYDLPLPEDQFLRGSVSAKEDMCDVGSQRSVKISSWLREKASLRSKLKWVDDHPNETPCASRILTGQVYPEWVDFFLNWAGRIIWNSIKTGAYLD